MFQSQCFYFQKTDLSVVEARISTQDLGDENKENNPSETAVLQQTVNRLNTDLHEMRVLVTNKDAEIHRITSDCSQLQTQLQDLVSQTVDTLQALIQENCITVIELEVWSAV